MSNISISVDLSNISFSGTISILTMQYIDRISILDFWLSIIISNSTDNFVFSSNPALAP